MKLFREDDILISTYSGQKYLPLSNAFLNLPHMDIQLLLRKAIISVAASGAVISLPHHRQATKANIQTICWSNTIEAEALQNQQSNDKQALLAGHFAASLICKVHARFIDRQQCESDVLGTLEMWWAQYQPAALFNCNHKLNCIACCSPLQLRLTTAPPCSKGRQHCSINYKVVL